MSGSSTPAAPDPLADTVAQLERFLPAYLAGAERVVAELRALDCPRRFGRPVTRAGFFDLPARQAEFVRAVRSLLADEAGPPGAVYVTLNPLHTDLLARAHNRIKEQCGRAGDCATDANVLGRRWLLVDVDPVKLAGVSATDREKAAARAVADGVRRDLDGRGWPAPMVVDSGNGYHLWYRIDLAADDGGLVRSVLTALGRAHDTAAAAVDTTVFNPSRIAKLPGTWARKGDSVPDRPHRMARVLEVPGA